MRDARLRANDQHLFLRRKKSRRGNYANRYLILIGSQSIQLSIILSSVTVDILSESNTLNIMSVIIDYVAAHLVSK